MLSSHVHKKFIMLDDAKKLIDKCPSLNLSVEDIMLAFSHSKELHIKEMEEIDRYSKLTQTEFLEFLARLGVLLFKSRHHLSLLQKLELVLIELFKLI